MNNSRYCQKIKVEQHIHAAITGAAKEIGVFHTAGLAMRAHKKMPASMRITLDEGDKIKITEDGVPVTICRHTFKKICVQASAELLMTDLRSAIVANDHRLWTAFRNIAAQNVCVA